MNRRLTSVLQFQDVVWVLFVGILIAGTQEETTNYDRTILVPLIGAFQIAEPRLKLFASRRGQIASIAIKLLLVYLLIEFTHGVDSPYHPLLLIPIVSAATILELPGVLLVSLLACLAYATSFLFYILYLNQLPYLNIVEEGILRMATYALVGIIVYQQAKAKREEMRRTEEAAERLVQTNRHLREAQASLRRSERLAALGQLTAGLAHELRNPLGTIKASAELLTKASTLARPEVMSEMAGYIVTETDRVNGLISNFLDFARPLQIHPVTADLRSVIADAVRQHSDLASKMGVSLAVKEASNITNFSFDPDLLKIALSNLLQNAIHASKAGQTVEIRVEQLNENVRIFVVDQGNGIAPEHLENIFNPFFTTKPQGIGLGLAIVSKIVDEHQGLIHLASQPGQGTTFTLTLPKEQHVSPPPAVASAQ
ncbi:MAG TPA: ATP-binding protein [Bryobacteraceae bacterium]|nr:ATP-binding protein [Bryobacteraceae bacterium]